MAPMPTDPRLRAQQQLANLLAILRRDPGGATAELLALGEALDRAIASFHMEAIRFRMYTLERQLAQPGLAVPPEVQTLYAAMRASLEEAGFHTRSVTS
jgi:hypothetical protein